MVAAKTAGSRCQEECRPNRSVICFSLSALVGVLLKKNGCGIARGLGKRTIGGTMYREFLSSLVEGLIDALAGYNELLIAVTYSRC
jgi:hypothetical protein